MLFASLVFGGFGFSQEIKTKGGRRRSFPDQWVRSPSPLAIGCMPEKLSLPCQRVPQRGCQGDEANLPSADLCLTCHRTIKAGSPEVAKLRAAKEEGKAIAWVPVYRVPDFVFFGHAPHIRPDFSAECHGAVGR